MFTNEETLQHRCKGNLNHSGTSTSVAVSTSLPCSFFSFCWMSRNAGPIVVNILYMYTIRQARRGSHVFHYCFNPDQSNPSYCICIWNLKVKTCCLVFDSEMWGFSSSSCDVLPTVLVFCFMDQFAQTTFDSFFQHQSPPRAHWYTLHVNSRKRQSRAKTRRDLLHESLIF